MATVNPIQGLSPRAETTVRRLSTVTVFILAAGAAVLSFSGLQTLALNAGFPPTVAWLLPVIVDGMVLTGSLGVVAANLVGISTWYPWLLTMSGVILSVWGNVASAPPDLTSQAVHAIAPLTFALSVEGMLRIYRASAHATAQREAKAILAEEKRLEREEKAAERAAKLALTQNNTQSMPNTQTSFSSKPAQQKTVKTFNNHTGQPTAREKISEYLQTHPDASGGQVARDLNLDPSYTRKLIRDIRGNTATYPTSEQTVENSNIENISSETVNAEEPAKINI